MGGGTHTRVAEPWNDGRGGARGGGGGVDESDIFGTIKIDLSEIRTKCLQYVNKYGCRFSKTYKRWLCCCCWCRFFFGL